MQEENKEINNTPKSPENNNEQQLLENNNEQQLLENNNKLDSLTVDNELQSSDKDNKLDSSKVDNKPQSSDKDNKLDSSKVDNKPRSSDKDNKLDCPKVNNNLWYLKKNWNLDNTQVNNEQQRFKKNNKLECQENDKKFAWPKVDHALTRLKSKKRELFAKTREICFVIFFMVICAIYCWINGNYNIQDILSTYSLGLAILLIAIFCYGKYWGSATVKSQLGDICPKLYFMFGTTKISLLMQDLHNNPNNLQWCDLLFTILFVALPFYDIKLWK